tara:strand:+ start:598 stop:1479 length:882 start_codon:yes stop_codon:yes gene_type:complete
MFTGSIAALVTPMLEDGSIDEASLRAYVDWQIEQGTNALVAVGTTGESPTLAVDEHINVVRIVVEQAAKRVPVIAGNGANCTREAIELTKGVSSVGADACLCVVPYYNKPTQQGLYLHFKAIAESENIPQLLYNVPGRTMCDLLPETVARLAEVPNIVGIKEATGDVERVGQLRALISEPFVLLSGDDETGLPFLRAGGDGVISVTTNVAPAKMARMVELAKDGCWDEAEVINNQLMPLHKELFVEANPIPVKWALWKMAKCGPAIRLPMTPLSPEFHPVVEKALISAEALEK